MLKVADLDRILNDAVPYSWAEDWDNVGLLLGDADDRVTGVAVALDPSLEAMRSAVDAGCSVLVTHHPLLLSPIKRLDCSEGAGARIAFAIRRRLSLFALHTNWDVSPRGVNAVIAEALDLREVRPLIPSTDTSGSWGIGAIGELPQDAPMDDLGLSIKRALGLSRLEVHGKPAGTQGLLALCGGSGGSLWSSARASGANMYFTADMKYHDRLDALDAGMGLLLADHGEMENFSMKELAHVVSRSSGIEAVLLDAPERAFSMI
ncbi:MAG: Nif3-like dinuclear metal center hexameric protein [Synergistaceae bacterium]|nr:Nif3-like dinuclear metal center hexameric protein [Synergistota bacterium]NLM70937.1 Nif3-like dinuclear metal center hexameric protein [Synergistaceae bacterium]